MTTNATEPKRVAAEIGELLRAHEERHGCGGGSGRCALRAMLLNTWAGARGFACATDDNLFGVLPDAIDVVVGKVARPGVPR